MSEETPPKVYMIHLLSSLGFLYKHGAENLWQERTNLHHVPVHLGHLHQSFPASSLQQFWIPDRVCHRLSGARCLLGCSREGSVAFLTIPSYPYLLLLLLLLCTSLQPSPRIGWRAPRGPSSPRLAGQRRSW